MAVRIILSKDELQALEKLAWHERRRVGVQAALIIRRELERVGMLPTNSPTPADRPTPITAQAQGGDHVDHAA